jgi:hypothetical protein
VLFTILISIGDWMKAQALTVSLLDVNFKKPKGKEQQRAK